MPEISRFFGIVIRMFVEAGETHHRPHFHAYYQDSVAVYAVDQIELIVGELPRPQHRLALAWAELHRRELLDDWDALQAGRHPAKIDPLR
jgi:hypothetical protein